MEIGCCSLGEHSAFVTDYSDDQIKKTNLGKETKGADKQSTQITAVLQTVFWFVTIRGLSYRLSSDPADERTELRALRRSPQ